jgi:hypothetical protein
MQKQAQQGEGAPQRQESSDLARSKAGDDTRSGLTKDSNPAPRGDAPSRAANR